MPSTIDVYEKPGCALCAEVVDALDELAVDFDLVVARHNILEDEALFAKYRYRVPVVLMGGIERLALRFDTTEILAALDAAQVVRRRA